MLNDTREIERLCSPITRSSVKKDENSKKLTGVKRKTEEVVVRSKDHRFDQTEEKRVKYNERSVVAQSQKSIGGSFNPPATRVRSSREPGMDAFRDSRSVRQHQTKQTTSNALVFTSTEEKQTKGLELHLTSRDQDSSSNSQQDSGIMLVMREHELLFFLTQWLSSIHSSLGAYAELLIDKGYPTLESLCLLRTEKDLEKIGITKLGHQIKLFAGITKMRERLPIDIVKHIPPGYYGVPKNNTKLSTKK